MGFLDSFKFFTNSLNCGSSSFSNSISKPGNSSLMMSWVFFFADLLDTLLTYNQKHHFSVFACDSKTGNTTNYNEYNNKTKQKNIFWGQRPSFCLFLSWIWLCNVSYSDVPRTHYLTVLTVSYTFFLLFYFRNFVQFSLFGYVQNFVFKSNYGLFKASIFFTS